MIRPTPLITGHTYHIYNRSIAKFQIFRSDVDCERLLFTARHYQEPEPKTRFSDRVKRAPFKDKASSNDRLVTILAYCLMPTHFHFILRQDEDAGITQFLHRVFTSYSRYFNTKYNRNGPLWENRFKSTLVQNDAQLEHLTRYVHLNPTTDRLVAKPTDWTFSSIHEYLGRGKYFSLCSPHLGGLSKKEYLNFVLERREDQQLLASVKREAKKALKNL